VFEKKQVLWRLFGVKRDGVRGGWRKLRNEERHNFYSSLSTIIMVKSRWIKWAGHVARMGRTGFHRKAGRKENTR
jgi:hypothetical protein